MTFKKTVNGVQDERINRKGRPVEDPEKKKKKTRREVRDSEYLMVLRKLRPHVAKSVAFAASTIENEGATDATRLKAAALLFSEYRQLVTLAYEGEDEVDKDTGEVVEAVEVQPHEPTPVFSLRIIDRDGNIVED